MAKKTLLTDISEIADFCHVMLDISVDKYSHAPHNDVSVNDRPDIGQWSQNITML